MPRTIPLSDSEKADANGDLIPAGEYFDVLIEDVKEVTSKSVANAGKPMYQIRLRIFDDGVANQRAIVTSVCLWKGAHFSLVQLNKALNLPATNSEGLVIPDESELVGQRLAIRIKHAPMPGGSDLRANVERFLEQNGGAKTASRASGRVPLAALPARGEAPAAQPAVAKAAPKRRPAGARTPAAAE